MAEWTAEEVQNAAREIMERCATDRDFRASVLADIKGAIEEHTGKSVGDDVNMQAVDNAGSDFTFVIPDFADADEALSDDDLEGAAGGRCGGTCAGASEVCLLTG